MANEFNGQIKGTAYWPFLRSKHKLSGKYQITLGNLDAATVDALKAAGGSVLKREAEGNCIILKSTFLPEVVDAKGRSIPDDVITTIGNGSKVIVKAVIKPSNFKNAMQGLNGVQLLELVEFQGTGGFDVQEGYTVGSVSNSASEWEDQVNE